MNLEEAQKLAHELTEFMVDNDLRNCLCCEASLSKSNHAITAGMVSALAKMYAHVIRTGKNDVNPRKDMDRTENELTKDEDGNWTKLRFHALIAKVKENGQHKRGRWLITRRGAQFLRGEIQIPARVWTFRNHIVERSEEMVTVAQVYGSEPYYPTYADFPFEQATEEDIATVKTAKARKKKVRCHICTKGEIKRRMTADIVDNVARPTYWNVCTNCGWKEKTT
jgi:hypothetical protein